MVKLPKIVTPAGITKGNRSLYPSGSWESVSRSDYRPFDVSRRRSRIVKHAAFIRNNHNNPGIICDTQRQRQTDLVIQTSPNNGTIKKSESKSGYTGDEPSHDKGKSCKSSPDEDHASTKMEESNSISSTEEAAGSSVPKLDLRSRYISESKDKYKTVTSPRVLPAFTNVPAIGIVPKCELTDDAGRDERLLPIGARIDTHLVATYPLLQLREKKPLRKKKYIIRDVGIIPPIDDHNKMAPNRRKFIAPPKSRIDLTEYHCQYVFPPSAYKPKPKTV